MSAQPVPFQAGGRTYYMGPVNARVRRLMAEYRRAGLEPIQADPEGMLAKLKALEWECLKVQYPNITRAKAEQLFRYYPEETARAFVAMMAAFYETTHGRD